LQVKLLKYVKDQETSVFAERIRLDKEMFALQFDPVTDKVGPIDSQFSAEKIKISDKYFFPDQGSR
jgi:hypothetical protein